MAEVTTISLKDNGPILVEGSFKLILSDGTEIPIEGSKAWLCRCGSSSKKPFCDGTHKRIGFNTANSETAE